jgi:hypothetical protein
MIFFVSYYLYKVFDNQFDVDVRINMPTPPSRWDPCIKAFGLSCGSLSHMPSPLTQYIPTLKKRKKIDTFASLAVLSRAKILFYFLYFRHPPGSKKAMVSLSASR